MGIRELAKPECDPSGGSSAKSLPTCFATEQKLGFQQLLPLAQTLFHSLNCQLLYELQVVGSGARQITEPCGAVLKTDGKKHHKTWLRYRVVNRLEINAAVCLQ